MTKPLRMELADYIRELTAPHQHAEHYTIRDSTGWAGRDHRIKAPALVTQLWYGDLPSAAVEDGLRPGYQSKPAARLEAYDAAVRIDLEAARWVRDLGEDDPGDRLEKKAGGRKEVVRGSGTIACIRLLGALAASADEVTRRAVERDVRRWWTQARVVTGWDSPAWTPDNTCPQCGVRGTLKVKLGDAVAMCTNDPCRVTWDQDNIGLLADHIRAESEAEKVPRVGPGPCYCPLPKPIVPDLSRTCGRCGSARCTHALQSRLLDTIRAGRDGRLGA
ncbi:hypothetical protein [Nocardioides speluncae]|uniref:hypothetical protein n=1 Tax=Nocardioides speluncae TaxID=2670337 RepID=UPI000D69B855|nr:hypothetical protein [Nocardioides speluncae]